MENITEFKGEHRWLSNFYLVEVTLDGVTYPSVENAYQAAKSCEDRGVFVKCSPSMAKRLGRGREAGTRFSEDKLLIMLQLLRDKFSDPELRHLLITTGNAKIVEGNNWGDTFWGVCDGRGSNHLGNLLMQVRSEIRKRSL